MGAGEWGWDGVVRLIAVHCINFVTSFRMVQLRLIFRIKNPFSSVLKILIFLGEGGGGYNVFYKRRDVRLTAVHAV